MNQAQFIELRDDTADLAVKPIIHVDGYYRGQAGSQLFDGKGTCFEFGQHRRRYWVKTMYFIG